MACGIYDDICMQYDKKCNWLLFGLHKNWLVENPGLTPAGHPLNNIITRGEPVSFQKSKCKKYIYIFTFYKLSHSCVRWRGNVSFNLFSKEEIYVND